MSFTVTGNPERVLSLVRYAVQRHGGSMNNIHQSVGPTYQDRYGNLAFDAESTQGVEHDCAVTIRVLQTTVGKCLVEVVARRYKCDRNQHIPLIEKALWNYYGEN